MPTPFPIQAVRDRFPALAVADDGALRLYADAPGGTQVCRDAIDAVAAHMAAGTANAGGAFRTSAAVDQLSADAHAAAADLFGGHPDEVAFGPNMTSLTLAAARALSRGWAPGDELVVTRADHDANVAPWLQVAADRDMAVRWLDFDPETGGLRLDELPGLLGPRTRLVAVGGASNALGAVHDLAAVVAAVRERSDALVYVDAVQLAPHLPVDVAAIGCDLMACSPYKLFGPHAGLLWARRAVWEGMEAYKVRPAATDPPARRLETGTPSFEAMAGLVATVGYLEWLGDQLSPGLATRRERIIAAMAGATTYEEELSGRMLAGLTAMNGVTLYGPREAQGRVPTFAFTLEGAAPRAVAEALAARNIFAWAGHFYAVETMARLGVAETGGLVRVGLCHYNTADEVDRLLAALREIAAG